MRRVSPRQPVVETRTFESEETQGVYESQIGEDTQSQKENAPKRRTLPNTRSRPVSPIKPPRAKKKGPKTPQAESPVTAQADHSLPLPPSRGRSELSVMAELELSASPEGANQSLLLSQGDEWDQPAPASASVTASATSTSLAGYIDLATL